MGLMDKLNSYAKYTDQDVYRPGQFNPGLFALDKARVKKLRPRLFGLAVMVMGSSDTWQRMDVLMNDGDLQPAVVVSLAPLLVACYTDEFDAVTMYCFPEELAVARGWGLHTRLLAVTGYNGMGTVRRSKDIDPGRGGNSKYRSVGSIVADLYTAKTERLARKKGEIPEAAWQYTIRLAEQYMADHPGMARDGLGWHFKDAVPIDSIRVSSKVCLD